MLIRSRQFAMKSSATGDGGAVCFQRIKRYVYNIMYKE